MWGLRESVKFKMPPGFGLVDGGSEIQEQKQF